MKIELKHINFSYDPDITGPDISEQDTKGQNIKSQDIKNLEKIILKNINASFSSGQFYSIIGPNGSGKTTLLDVMTGYYKPSRGSISLEYENISQLSKKQVAKTIALVSQDYAVNFPFSVQEVVLMGRHPHIPRFSHPTARDFDKTGKAMELCRISHLADRRITELSGGERQRCIFARALCQDTPILLLDEAFSNMDINHTLQILRLVKKEVMENDKLVISVFHDLNLAASWSDEILMLKKGEVKAFGLSDTVMTPENIQEVFGVSSVVEFNPHVQAKQVYYPTH